MLVWAVCHCAHRALAHAPWGPQAAGGARGILRRSAEGTVGGMAPGRRLCGTGARTHLCGPCCRWARKAAGNFKPHVTSSQTQHQGAYPEAGLPPPSGLRLRETPRRAAGSGAGVGGTIECATRNVRARLPVSGGTTKETRSAHFRFRFRNRGRSGRESPVPGARPVGPFRRPVAVRRSSRAPSQPTPRRLGLRVRVPAGGGGAAMGRG